jgi:hypothetical protein
LDINFKPEFFDDLDDAPGGVKMTLKFTIQVVQANGVTHNYYASEFHEAIAIAEQHLHDEDAYASHYRIFMGDFSTGTFLVAEKYGAWSDYEIRNASEI